MRGSAIVASCLMLGACGRLNFDGGRDRDGGDDDASDSGSGQMDAPDSCTPASGTLSVLGQQPDVIWNGGAYRVVWVDNTAAIAQLAYAAVTNDGVKSSTTKISTSTKGVVGGQFLAPLGTKLITGWQQHTDVVGTDEMVRADFTLAGQVNYSAGDFRDAPQSSSIARRFPILTGASGATILVSDLRSGDFKTYGDYFDNDDGDNAGDFEIVAGSARDVIHDAVQMPDANIVLYESAGGALRIGRRDLMGVVSGADIDVTSSFMGLAGIGASPSLYGIVWSDGAGLMLTRVDHAFSVLLHSRVDESVQVGDSWPSVVWTGDRWVVGWIDETARTLHVVTIDEAGVPLTTLVNQSAPGTDTQIALAANGASVFVAWSSTSGVTYQLLCP